MDDDVITQISKLVEDEHRLRSVADHEMTPDDREQLDQLEVRLDQCWDLLRQRRAKRDSGGDPTDAHVRSETVVEHYQQ